MANPTLAKFAAVLWLRHRSKDRKKYVGLAADVQLYTGITVDSDKFKYNKDWLTEVSEGYLAAVEKDPDSAVHEGDAFENWIPTVRMALKNLKAPGQRAETVDLTVDSRSLTLIT